MVQKLFHKLFFILFRFVVPIFRVHVELVDSWIRVQVVDKLCDLFHSGGEDRGEEWLGQMCTYE